MNASLSILLHVLFILSSATLLLGTLCGIVAPLFMQWTKKFDAQSRLLLLRLYSATPLLGALVIGAMISIPAIGHTSALPLDHCHNNACVGPSASHMATTTELIVIGAVLCLLLRSITTAFSQWLRARQLLSQLSIVSESALSSQVQAIDSPLPIAFSLGIFKPRAVISTNLLQELTPLQRDIVCAHETVHVNCRDGLYKWLIGFMSIFHWPGVGRSILEEHGIASEIRADHDVASAIGDNIAVAETIIKVQRLMGPVTHNDLMFQFLGSAIEQRVHSLLTPSTGSIIPRHTFFFAIFCTLVVAMCGSVPLHNVIETLIMH